MAYIKLSDSTYPITEDQIREANPQTSYPRPMPAEVPEYAWVYLSAQPTFDSLTQEAVEIAPVQVEGVWTQQWVVSDLDAGTVAINQTQAEASRVASLWQAAHDVEYAAISGSAIGLITIGLMTGKPKCAAVQNWIKALWAEYYARKFGGSANTDFSAFAACPHSVPELMAEVGV